MMKISFGCPDIRRSSKVISGMILAWGSLLTLCMGCAKLPCYPPEYFAPDVSAPYGAEEVRVPAPGGYFLAGTLTLPATSSPPYPAVLLITGSSPQNRDHMQSREAPVCNYKPFRQIADAISRKGIAVLRMDDQGTGCSGGRPLENVTIQARADDSRAGIQYLRARKEIDGERIGLLGMSEGGNIGPMIAASDPEVRAVVVMAGSATNGFKISEYQRRIKLSERLDLTDAQKERALARSMAGLHHAFDRGEGSPWFRSFLAYTPLPAAMKVSCPVLILHGDRDTHVPVDHAALLAKAMRSGGNPDVTLKIYENYNHLFLEDPDGRFSRYGNLLAHTSKLPENVLDTIAEWLSQRLMN